MSTTTAVTFQKSLDWLRVATRASGETLQLAVHTIRGRDEGPALGLLSTSHGDEIFTIEIIRGLINSIGPEGFRGSIRAMPVANPIAFETFTRTTGQGMNTDNNNLNRVFPGTPHGWLTDRMAHLISTKFLPGLNCLIDFHCGSAETAIDYVLVEDEDTKVGQRSLEYSKLLGTRLLYKAPLPEQSGTLTQHARNMGIPTVVAQLGGSAWGNIEYLQRSIRGIKNIMIELGMIHEPIHLPKIQHVLSGARTLLRPSEGGLFIPDLGYDMLGQTVPAGTVLGRVISPHTLQELEVLRANYDKTVLIMMRGTLSRVNPGDYAYILGNGQTTETIRNSNSAT